VGGGVGDGIACGREGLELEGGVGDGTDCGREGLELEGGGGLVAAGGVIVIQEFSVKRHNISVINIKKFSVLNFLFPSSSILS
jgi:hypothetical protein